MNDETLRKISNQLTILIRLESLKEGQEKMKISEILELVSDMGLTDNEVGLMFNVSAQAIRNARSNRKRKV